MANESSCSSLLLALPDPCLLAVLQCCAADDQRSLCSAARAHSRLQQAAVLALRSVRVGVTKQAQADGVLSYLRKYAWHVDSLNLGDSSGMRYRKPALGPLPMDLRLRSLQLDTWQLQDGGLQGELGPLGEVSALKQLCLRDCEVLDGMADVLAATLSQLRQLPAGLEHLCISGIDMDFPARVLQQLQGLTYLELGDLNLPGTDPTLQSLQALTRLRDLRLQDVGETTITASMLSGMHDLTRLELSRDANLEPSALAGKTYMQHLHLDIYHKDAADLAQLLSHLQHLQQLTHLFLQHNMWVTKGEAPVPAAAYAALTASSKLQYVSARGFGLPVDAWQHVLPPGRQLRHLRSLSLWVTGTYVEVGTFPIPQGTSLVSCCPGLKSLYMANVPHSEAVLGPLTALSGLKWLKVDNSEATVEGMGALCQLTGLKFLSVVVHETLDQEGLLLQLTKLKQLTTLAYLISVHLEPGEGAFEQYELLKTKVGGEPPREAGESPTWSVRVVTLGLMIAVCHLCSCMSYLDTGRPFARSTGMQV
jgi:hypothetical protein